MARRLLDSIRTVEWRRDAGRAARVRRRVAKAAATAVVVTATGFEALVLAAARGGNTRPCALCAARGVASRDRLDRERELAGGTRGADADAVELVEVGGERWALDPLSTPRQHKRAPWDAAIVGTTVLS